MLNFLNRIVDSVLTIRRLKGILFILILLLLLVLILSVLSESQYLSAYMIGLSALFASTTAMINFRQTYVNKIIERISQESAMVNNYIIRIHFFKNKSKTYNDMILGKTLFSKELLLNMKVIIKDILEIIESKNLSIYMGGDKAYTLYKLHDNLYYLFLQIDTLSSSVIPKQMPTATPPPNQEKIMNEIDEELKTLESYLIDIHEKGRKEYEKLGKEESLEKLDEK